MKVIVEHHFHNSMKDVAMKTNKAVRKFTIPVYAKPQKELLHALRMVDVSPLKKKEILLYHFHTTLISTFALQPNKITSNSRMMNAFKHRLHVLRGATLKLRNVNFFLEEGFLPSMAKKTKVFPKSRKKQKPLSKKDVEKLEYAAYHFIDKIISLDKQALDTYKKKEASLVKARMLEAKDYHALLHHQSEIVEHIEAKLPPPSKVGKELFKPDKYAHWVARLFSLTAALLSSYELEKEILKKVKKNKTIQNEIKKRITHLNKEYSKLLKIEQERYTVLRSNNPALKEALHNAMALAGV